MMKNIRPITDLRKTNELSELAHRQFAPIFITKNGYGDLVVMSQEYYDMWHQEATIKQNIKTTIEQELPQTKNMGYVKVACATIDTLVANPMKNAKAMVDQVLACQSEGVKLLVFGELTISGYTCQDLFLQNHLLSSCEEAVMSFLKETEKVEMVVIFGVPVRYQQKLYNCAVVALKGKILGIVPKTAIPNYNEFYELRHFTPAPSSVEIMTYAKQQCLFGNHLLFQCLNMKDWKIGVEICEDLWIPNPPSTEHALAGATMICNLSASNEIVGKQAYREMLVSSTSARLICTYLYASCGNGESTTDLVFSGANMIAENGTFLAKAKLFRNETIITEVDIEKLVNERQRMTSYPAINQEGYQIVPFTLSLSVPSLTRVYSPTPFIPFDPQQRFERIQQILQMQVMGLKKRIDHTNCKTLVLGLSGGLDSTLALLVAKEAMETLKRNSQDIHCLTMPCFGTSERTRKNAHDLAKALHVTCKEIDITKAVRQHFQDIQHDESVQDVTYENAQARERTQVLMDYANQTQGLVIGTGDLSELALGWATYNGDHMSNYGVNASIPKTLVRHIVYHYAKTHPDLENVLLDILDTPVSPELLPTKNGEIAQVTEDTIGPYELHDFFLYHFLRNQFRPKKIYFLAQKTFEDKYDNETILKWLKVFIRRFFSQQFKRSCLPDGVKVGSVSLSPRGDLRMPSDASSETWLKELEE